jgi:membrane protease YdiL (CAAX protease family)
LYWLPVLLLGAPLVAGLKVPAPSAVLILVIGYVATAIFEETMWRGLVLKILRPLGVWPAVLGSAVLFGLGHLSNSALRGFSALILLQAFGAAVHGVGLAALRLRTQTIWPLIAIHALHDLSLQLGSLPIAAVEAPVATIICVYGIYLLRQGRGEAPQRMDA